MTPQERAEFNDLLRRVRQSSEHSNWAELGSLNSEPMAG